MQQSPRNSPKPPSFTRETGGKRRGRAGSSRGLPRVNSPRRLKPVLAGKARPEPRSRSAARTPQEGALGPPLARLPSSPSSSPSSSGGGSGDEAPQPPAPHGHPGGVPCPPARQPCRCVLLAACRGTPRGSRVKEGWLSGALVLGDVLPASAPPHPAHAPLPLGGFRLDHSFRSPMVGEGAALRGSHCGLI